MKLSVIKPLMALIASILMCLLFALNFSGISHHSALSAVNPLIKIEGRSVVVQINDTTLQIDSTLIRRIF
ncbi:hypothetical protein [Aliikangiella maris]|uniref:Uncharacterized protein n=2 Tax=Aliikangiella maris TaxID=3162458 RepID=A0ABV2BX38_9GAMM